MTESERIGLEAYKALHNETQRTANHVAEIVRMFPTILKDHVKALERIAELEHELDIKEYAKTHTVMCRDCFNSFKWGDLKCKCNRDVFNTIIPVRCEGYRPKVYCINCLFYRPDSNYCAQSLDHGHHRCGNPVEGKSCNHFKLKVTDI